MHARPQLRRCRSTASDAAASTVILATAGPSAARLGTWAGTAAENAGKSADLGQRVSFHAGQLDDHGRVPRRGSDRLASAPSPIGHRHSAAREAPALVDPAGQPRRVMIDEHDGRALGQPLFHGYVERSARSLVQARPCLIEHQQPRTRQKRLGHRYLLAHPLGQSPHRRAGVFSCPESIEPLVGRRRDCRARQAVDPRHMRQVLTRRETQPAGEALRHVAGPRPPGHPAGRRRGHAGHDA